MWKPSLLLPLAILIGIFAQSSQAQFDGGAASQASLVSEAATIAPGSTFTVALSLRHPDGWHSYYRNSGGVEEAPAIVWELPEGFSTGEIQWPTPEVKDGYFGKSFIYPGNPVFLVEITAPPKLGNGDSPVTLRANATWQICKESCINEERSFTLSLPVGDALVIDESRAAVFREARAALPVAMETLSSRWEISADVIQLTLSGIEASVSEFTDFIPDQRYAASVSSGGSLEEGDGGILITLPVVRADPLDNPIPLGDSISGILLGRDRSIAIPETMRMDGSTANSTEPANPPEILGVFFGMFLGGLILNLMPCVFPVIGLKIMGFVQQAGQDHRKVMLHGVVFTLGVLVSFAALSTMLYLLKSSWGFQLQNPWVVLVLMIVMLLLALNMSGVFEIGTSATSIGGSLQAKQGLTGTFFSGILATIVATPCSAPFLGSAMAAAVNLSALPFFAAFGAMAIGLSTPYLLLSLFPRLVDHLPRPGPWMESFKQAMAFPLYATAGYLLWVYAAQIDLENLLGPVFGLCLLAMACWIHGRWNVPSRAPGVRKISMGVSLCLAVGGFFIAMPPAKSAIEWQSWSQEAVDAALADGNPVYIDFTATWCATCQVNKKRAYPEEVVKHMSKAGVVAFKADKTKPNPEIERALKRYGRTAIPVNVLQAPGQEPVILPELLSSDDVLQALDMLDRK